MISLTVERAPALAALSRAVGVVERKNTIPILSNVVVRAEGGELVLRATDLDMEAIERIPAGVETGGEISVPADKLHDIVRAAPEGADVSLALTSADPRMRVRSGRSGYWLPCLSTETFPTFEVEGLDREFAIPAKLLADMIARVGFCTAPASPLYNMSCIALIVKDGRLFAVGTQRSGLAVREEAAPEGADGMVMLPPKFTTQLTRRLADAEGDALISWTRSLCRVRHGGAALTSKLFDSTEYVPWDRVLLREHEVTASLARDELTAAVKRAQIMADAKNLSVTLTFGDGALKVHAQNQQAGEGADEIGCNYDGPDYAFRLTTADLLNAMSSMKGDVMEIAFCPYRDDKVTNTSQVVLKAPSDAGFICNLMQPRA